MTVIWFYLVTYIRTILCGVLAMACQEALVIITVQQLIALKEAGVPPYRDNFKQNKHGRMTGSPVLTLPTLAVSSFAFSRTNMTPCDVDATASSSASTDGALRPPTIATMSASAVMKVACVAQVLALSYRFLCCLCKMQCPTAQRPVHVAIRSNYGACLKNAAVAV